jgi:hypothetical protein
MNYQTNIRAGHQVELHQTKKSSREGCFRVLLRQIVAYFIVS